MNAAIYARKSTEQKGVADAEKSVSRQIKHAKEFAQRRGWTVDDAHIYVDDGISGAEFEKRLGLQQLLAQRREFQVLIVSEQKSLGRETSETQYLIKQLAESGVEIFEYVHGQSLTPKTWMDKVMSAFRSGADEAHQAQSRERVHESHSDKFRRGYVVGGRVFGYRNRNVYAGVDAHGRPLKSHVERIIEEREAAVVRRIYEMYASGLGLKAITKQLTRDNAVAPTPFIRKKHLDREVAPITGWSPSTIRTILKREIYRGMLVWNKSRKRNDWGKVDQKPRSESEWIRTPAKELQFVSDELWAQVEARRQEIEGKALRFDSGRLSGRPPKHATRNLLAGLATCAVCGGGLVVETSGRKRGRIAEYVCHRHRHNGTCSNALRRPVSEMNEAVLRAVEEHALTPEAVEHVIQLTERDDVREQQERIAREHKDVERRIKHLRNAVETGGDAMTLVARLRELEMRQCELLRELGSLQPVPRLPAKVVEDRLTEWRRLLRSSTTQGRSVLQRILRGRITFTPRAGGDGYDFHAPTRYDKLFTGIILDIPSYLPKSRRGFEATEPEDTFDGDYGRLLERAYRKIGMSFLRDR